MKTTIEIKNGKAGLIDINGIPLTDFIYDDLSSYYEEKNGCSWALYEDNFISMRLNNKWGILNQKGEIIIDFLHENKVRIEKLGKNLVAVLDNKYYLININGEKIKELPFDCVIVNLDEFAIVSLNELFGLINNNGDLILECKYKWIDSPPQSKYFALLNQDDNWGVMNLEKEIVIDFKYDSIEICRIDDNQYSFIVEFEKKSALLNEKGEQIA